MAYNIFIPQYIRRTEERKTRDIISNTDWNELFNLNISQGDHNSEYLYELSQYLFGAQGTSGIINTFETHLADISNPHQVTKAQVGLGNVDNTSDLNKPVSTAMQLALDLKESIAAANALIKSVSFNEQTGVFTFTKQDNSTISIDTLLEKLAINFRYDADTQSLIITLKDGTVQTIPLSDFITEFEFNDTSTITFDVISHKVSAAIKSGSITDDMLSSALVAQLIGYVSSASASASAAQNSEIAALGHKNAAAASATSAATASTASHSWATGGTGSRSGEETNNSRYFSQVSCDASLDAREDASEARRQAELAGQYAGVICPTFSIDLTTGHLIMTTEGRNIEFVLTEDKHLLFQFVD